MTTAAGRFRREIGERVVIVAAKYAIHHVRRDATWLERAQRPGA